MATDRFLELARMCVPYAYGQRFQDVWAWYVSGLRSHGYFVEFGALNGRDFSNSYLLELLGWDGCVAEPHPDYAERLAGNRACFVSTKCISDVSGQRVGFKAVRGRPALSTMAAIDPDDYMEEAGRRSDYVLHEVETISLLDFLSEAGAPDTIDYLSIDTEGSELMILEAFDFGRYSIGALSVEHNFSPLREPLHRLLTSNGLVRVWTELSGHDDWYVSRAVSVTLDDAPTLPSSIDGLPRSAHHVNRLGVLASMYLDAGDRTTALELADELEALEPESPIVSAVRSARRT